MVITLELPSDVEARVRESAARQDVETVRRLLTEAVGPTIDAAVEALLRNPSHGLIRGAEGLTEPEFEALADELAAMTPTLPTLPDEAVSREGIYADHP